MDTILRNSDQNSQVSAAQQKNHELPAVTFEAIGGAA